MIRCKWCNIKNDNYINYHDNEWGVYNLDDSYLFEMLILEMFQAGLNWECILNKRENFRKAYCNFDIDKFQRTADGLGITNPLEGLPIFDIWAYAYEFIINTEDYKKWATQTEEFTATGFYISSTVESVVRYLFNDKDFEEDHTALSDVKWET